jgi:hypothetical protein
VTYFVAVKRQSMCKKVTGGNLYPGGNLADGGKHLRTQELRGSAQLSLRSLRLATYLLIVSEHEGAWNIS